jgi:rhamnogalacturonyl hydrolase YesR
METDSRNTRAPWPLGADPALLAAKAVKDLLSRKDFMLYDIGDVRALHYAEACAALGAVRFADLTGDAGCLRAIAERYDPIGLPPNTANHVDANVCGIIHLALGRALGDSSLLALGLVYADGQWREPLPDGMSAQTRFWIDDMWMIGILQAEAFRATGLGVYLERAAMELDAYADKLQQASGLFFHGPHAPHYWGRGNGWVAAGLAEIISLLPRANPHYPGILSSFRKMAEALRIHQAPSGMWRQLIDHEESWEETSCTAMFGYALCLGLSHGLLPQDVYAPVVRAAWIALAGRVDGTGKVMDVCAGTGQKDDSQFYLDRPRVKGDLHGQAPLLWFAHAILESGLTFEEDR